MKTLSSIKATFHAFFSADITAAKSSSVFFEGNIFYSYGTHYRAAIKTTDSAGKKYLLRNATKSSKTTAKHISGLWSACPDSFTVLHVYLGQAKRSVTGWADLTAAETINLQFDAVERCIKAATTKKAESTFNAERAAAQSNLETAQLLRFNIWADKLSKAEKKQIEKRAAVLCVAVDELNAEAAAKLLIFRAQQAEAAKRSAKREAERAERYKIERADYYAAGLQKIADWKAGKLQAFSLDRAVFPFDFLRFNPFTGNVQTSQGVTLTAAEAAKLFNALQRAGSSPTKIFIDKIKTESGSFEVSEITADYFKAGCHKIEMCEAANMFDQITNQ